jgi:hypothetical protein
MKAKKLSPKKGEINSPITKPGIDQKEKKEQYKNTTVLESVETKIETISNTVMTTMNQICKVLNGKGYRAEVGEWPAEEFEPYLIMEGWVAEIGIYNFPKGCNVIRLDGECYLIPYSPYTLKEVFQLDYADVIKNIAEWATGLPAKVSLWFEVDVPNGEEPDDFAQEISELINIDDYEVDDDEEDDDYPTALNYSIDITPQEVKQAVRKMKALEYVGDIKFGYCVFAY